MLNVVPVGQQLSLRTAPSPFGTGDLWRPLLIIVDHPTLPATPALDLLKEFGALDGVDVFSTDSHAQKRITFRAVGEETLAVEYWDARELVQGGIVRAPGLHQFISDTAAEHGLDLEEAAVARRLIHSRRAVRFDALVSGGRLFSTQGALRPRVAETVMSDEEACGLLGLYLRAHGDFTIRPARPIGTRLDFEQFYDAAGGALLPEVGRRQVALEPAFWDRGEHAQLRRLLAAVAARLGRALVARDYVAVRSRHWRAHERHGEIRYFFESLTLSLTGVLDVIARIAHLATGMDPRKIRDAGFGRSRWRSRLISSLGPARADWSEDHLSEGSQFVRGQALISELRNQIHSDVPNHFFDEPGPLVTGWTWYGDLVVIHGSEAAAMLKNVADDGDAWGLAHRTEAGAVSVDLHRFQRKALLHVIEGAAAVLAALPVPGLTASERARAHEIEQSLPRHSHTFATELRLLTAIRSRLRHGPESTDPPGLRD